MRASIVALTFAALGSIAATGTRQAPVHAAHAGASHASVLPTIADDYPRALAKARAAKVPIFVEAWAPW